LKQLNLIDKLHGGIILTGGGSQLKHLIQLTEYKTGLSARIGFPNEHLAAGHHKELMMPMYATCIGLILRGYDDFESNRLRFISSNSEESLNSENAEADVEGRFVEMAKTFEPTPQDFLREAFGESMHIPEAQHYAVASNENLSNEMISSNFPQTDIFDTIASQTQYEEESQEEKTKERTQLIGNIFGSVKNKVIYWFENIDDQKLD